MTYLFIGSDRKSFEESSNVSGRYVAFSKFADRIDAVVPTWKSLGLPASRDIMPNVTIHGTNGWTKIDGFLRTVILLTKLARQKKPDLIIARDPFEYGIVALVASRLSGVPFVAQLHTDLSSPWFASTSFGNRVRTWTAPFVVRHAKSLRVISQSLAENTKKLNLLDPEKITVVPPMYSDVWAGAEGDPEPRQNNCVLMVSRLEYEKDIPTAFRAFKRAMQLSHNGGLELVVLGSGGYKTQLESYVAQLGIANRVKFLGWIEAPWKLYQSAQVFLQPSFYEGFGMSIVEAYAHGCFCVATDAGIARELVTSSRDGTVCAVRDDECLARGIVNAIEQSEITESEKMARKAKIEKIIPYKTFDEYAEAFMGYLNTIAKNNLQNKPIPFVTFLKRGEINAIPVQECGEPLVDIPVTTRIAHRQGDGAKWLVAKLRKSVVEMLIKAADSLPDGYKFVVMSAYIPVSLQQKVWDRKLEKLRTDHPDWSDEKISQEVPKYAARPIKGAPHNTGGSIDVVILDDQGNELDMGSLFGGVGKSAHTRFAGLTETQKQNRQLLYWIMTNAGFINTNPFEWWHYAYGDRAYAAYKGEVAAIYDGLAQE